MFGSEWVLGPRTDVPGVSGRKPQDKIRHQGSVGRGRMQTRPPWLHGGLYHVDLPRGGGRPVFDRADDTRGDPCRVGTGHRSGTARCADPDGCQWGPRSRREREEALVGGYPFRHRPNHTRRSPTPARLSRGLPLLPGPEPGPEPEPRAKFRVVVEKEGGTGTYSTNWRNQSQKSR